jgi:hypothetical protein
VILHQSADTVSPGQQIQFVANVKVADGVYLAGRP